MKLIKISNRSRRDFTGEYECESCGHKHTGYGYDDRYFHHDVIPNMKCPRCGQSTVSLGLEPMPHATKYPDWMVI
jgi:rubrerythrin